VTPLESITLTTAIVGAVTGSVALVWTVWQFVLAGPRVKAEILEGRMGTDGFMRGGSAWAMSEGPPVFVLVVRARNRGRAPITVNAAGIELDGGMIVSQPPHPGIGQTLPHRLEAGTSAEWAVELDPVIAAFRVNAQLAMSTKPRVRANIELATGKVATSRKWLSLPEKTDRPR